MKYCPVLVRIVDPEIQKFYNNATFLLQVWEKYGKKVFEACLHGKTLLSNL